MVSYSSWNGVKMHGNKYLLTDCAERRTGFRVFSFPTGRRLTSFRRTTARHRAGDHAGLDMIMIPNGPGNQHYVEFINDLKALVAEGKVSQSRIDDPCARVL